MEWTPWRTAATTRGRPPKAAVGERNEPIWNAPLPAVPSAYREPPRSAARDAKNMPDKPEVQEIPLPDSDDEAAKRSLMDVESTSVPNPWGASSSSSSSAVATHSTPPDPCVTTPVRPTRPRSLGPSESVTGKSLVSPVPKTLRSAVGEDDAHMWATIAEITEVCEEPQPDWESLASSENVGSTCSMRRHGARMVHLRHLREHKVYEELDLPHGVKHLAIRWVDKADYTTTMSGLTAGGYEQELTGQENFYSATPQPATLRVLLVLAQALGLAVAVGDCAQAFLQGPLLQKSDIWVTPPPEAEVKPGRAL